MATVRDVLTKALYRARVVALGVTPKSKELDDGLFVVQSFYDNLVQGRFFGALTPVYVTSDYTAKEFERVFITSGTVTLPTTVLDGAVVRQPRDLAAITVIDGAPAHYVWDDAWVSLSGLTLDSAAPLASRGQDGLACAIAKNWCEMFGFALSATVESKADRFLSSLMRIPDLTFERALTNNRPASWWSI